MRLRAQYPCAPALRQFPRSAILHARPRPGPERRTWKTPRHHGLALLFGLVAAIVAPASAVHGQTPIGEFPEFEVAGPTGYPNEPAISSSHDGHFVVVWSSSSVGGPDLDDRSVRGQRFAPDGVPTGPAFQINSQATGTQEDASVASAADGSFAVVWTDSVDGSDGRDGSGSGIFGQRHAANGSPAGPEFQVNTTTAGDQAGPKIGGSPLGKLVVVWSHADTSDPNLPLYPIRGQRYSSNGSPTGAEFQISTYNLSESTWGHDVGMSPDGSFVVVWGDGSFASPGQDGSEGGIFGQRYASDGSPAGSEFQVNAFTE